jgi:hypothetical protein
MSLLLLKCGKPGAHFPFAFDSELLQVFNTLVYSSATVDGLTIPIIASEDGTLAVPRGQRCVSFDGMDDHATLGAVLGTAPISAFTITFNIVASWWSRTVASNGYFVFGQKGWLITTDTDMTKVALRFGVNVRALLYSG